MPRSSLFSFDHQKAKRCRIVPITFAPRLINSSQRMENKSNITDFCGSPPLCNETQFTTFLRVTILKA